MCLQKKYVSTSETLDQDLAFQGHITRLLAIEFEQIELRNAAPIEMSLEHLDFVLSQFGDNLTFSEEESLPDLTDIISHEGNERSEEMPYLDQSDTESEISLPTLTLDNSVSFEDGTIHAEEISDSESNENSESEENLFDGSAILFRLLARPIPDPLWFPFLTLNVDDNETDENSEEEMPDLAWG